MKFTRSSAIDELVPLLRVHDMNESLAFYRNQLGFQLAATWEPQGTVTWCRLERGNSAIMLQQAEEEDGPKEGRGRGVELFFGCDDADAIYAEFSERGLRIDPPETAFYGMRQVFFCDPDGFALCFQSPVDAA